MSIFSTLNTAISGMSAQANRLGTIGDNIANSATTGYKRATTEFETLLGTSSPGLYESGGVQTKVRYGIGDQGTLVGSSSVSDLAISGDGFFLVQGSNGQNVLTRAGSFVPDASGNLVNAAGYKLLGYNLGQGASSDQLNPINISAQALASSPSTKGSISANFPSAATVVPSGSLPSTNSASATYTAKTTVTAYDNLGAPVTLDVYMSKTGSNTWEVSVYNKASAAAGGGFPYSTAALQTQNLTFDGTTGKLTSSSPSSLSVAIPNGKTVAIDMSSCTQLAADFSVAGTSMDGSAPSKLDHITIGQDGTISSVYANGKTIATNRIPLATVASPGNLTADSGNVYEANADSGAIVTGTANQGNLGAIASGSLESSTVDIATELTNMIATQRSYEANSKVLQTGADMLSTINNLHT